MKVIFSLILALAILCSAVNETYACTHQTGNVVSHCACLQVLPFGLVIDEQIAICSTCHRHKCQGQSNLDPSVSASAYEASSDSTITPLVFCAAAHSVTTVPTAFAQHANPPPTWLRRYSSKLYLQKRSLLI